MRTSFWIHFTSGYGMTFLSYPFVARTHINAGMFGLVGFPLIALFYALFRRSQDSRPVS